MSRTFLCFYTSLLNLKHRPLPREERGWSEHAQYLEDGRVISDRMGHFSFVARALYSAANYFALQLPENYHVLIDMDQYINSFTIVNNNGDRVSADPWRLGVFNASSLRLLGLIVLLPTRGLSIFPKVNLLTKK